MSSSPYRIRQHVLPGQYIREYSAATAESQEDDLYLHINQYTPVQPVDAHSLNITIIGAPANGLTKELFEPLWDDLHQCLSSKGIGIHGVWIADQVHQGESSVLNEGKLGNDPSWHDHSRDLLHMINHFRHQMPRPLVGIGHSMGGQELTHLALFHPRLFSLLILIDPVIIPAKDSGGNASIAQALSKRSAVRRDIWSSRAEAATAFRKNRIYQRWDHRVLDRWMQYSLRDLPTLLYPESPSKDGTQIPVTLKTTKHQEVLTFMRPSFKGRTTSPVQQPDRKTHADLDPNIGAYPFYRPEAMQTAGQLPHIRPPVLYLFGGRSEISPESWRRQRLEMTGKGVGGSGGAKHGQVSGHVLENTSHYLPFEEPNTCAGLAADWLSPKLEDWKQDEEQFRKMWDLKSKVEKTTLSQEFLELLEVKSKL